METLKTENYYDYNSTTPVDSRVLESMLPYFSVFFGNASSKTHAYGWQAEAAVEKAREQVASLLKAEKDEIIFTSGATESIKLALDGLYNTYLSKGKKFITSVTEHKAVLDCFRALEKKGAEVIFLPVNKEGLLDSRVLAQNLDKQTVAVCIMLANNETGVIQNMSELASLTHQAGALLISDTTQAFGKIRVDVNELGIDLACVSAHKFYGPKGIGALYVRRKNPRVSLNAIMETGAQERGIRSGTLNVPGIVGLGKASELAQLETWENAQHASTLRAIIEHRLLEYPNVRINGSTKNRLYNTSNLTFHGFKAQELIKNLFPFGLSMGSACTSSIAEPSHVLSAMGLSEEDCYSTVRFSLGKYNSKEGTIELVDKIEKLLKRGN